MAVGATSTTKPLLIFRVGALLCALPLIHVVEITRPLMVDPLSGAPEFVAGLTVLRGAPVPVVNAHRLLREEDRLAERFVVVRAGSRRVALAVDAVLGFNTIGPEHLASLPPLVSAVSELAVAELGQIDGQLLLVLQASSLVPAELFDALDAEAVA